MVQLDISALVNQLENVSGIPDQGMELTGTDYLLKHIALPLLNGEDILIQDIDFGAFDEDDVRVMRQLCEEMKYIRDYFGMVQDRAEKAGIPMKQDHYYKKAYEYFSRTMLGACPYSCWFRLVTQTHHEYGYGISIWIH